MDIVRWLRNQWDRALAVAAVLLGIVALILGWIGVSGSTLATQQIPYLASGGLLGIFALGIGATLWLSADLRDEWRVLDDIRRELRREGEGERQRNGRGHDDAVGESGQGRESISSGRS